MKKSFQQQAIMLRKQGWSYNVIIDRLGVSKSTLSAWLQNVPYTPNKSTLKRIKNGPAKSADTRRKIRLDKIAQIHTAAAIGLGKISQRDLWMAGIGIYIGEGSKKFEEVRIVNSNPMVIRIAVLWLREICMVPKDNLQLRLYAYPDTNIEKAKKFWQQTTGLPMSAFAKTHIDERTNKKAKKWSVLPHGTLHIVVRSYGDKTLGVSLHRKIMGWIESFYKHAGVV